MSQSTKSFAAAWVLAGIQRWLIVKTPQNGRDLMAVLAITASCSVILLPANLAIAHSGGLNAEGCHNNRKTGDYHCHRAGGGSKQSRRPQAGPVRFKSNSQVYYRNCGEARAAGAAPIMRGEAGYAGHLDRDNDGVACE